MNIFWIIILFIVLNLMGVFGDASKERLLIADDLSNGKICLNEDSKKMLGKADEFLGHASKRSENNKYIVWANDNEMFEAFIAKVWIERARLDMEIKGCEGGT